MRSLGAAGLVKRFCDHPIVRSPVAQQLDLLNDNGGDQTALPVGARYAESAFTLSEEAEAACTLGSLDLNLFFRG